MEGSFGFQVAGCKFRMKAVMGKRMNAWRIWVAMVLLVDAGIGLLGLSRFEKIIPARILTRIALCEAASALALVAWHFLRS